MSQLASELLAKATSERPERPTPGLRWRSDNLAVPLVDLEDAKAVSAVLDADG